MTADNLIQVIYALGTLVTAFAAVFAALKSSAAKKTGDATAVVAAETHRMVNGQNSRLNDTVDALRAANETLHGQAAVVQRAAEDKIVADAATAAANRPSPLPPATL
jgi:hypothetical protein